MWRRVRYGRVMQTFLADDDGRLLADCYVANNDEELILLCESAAPDDLAARIIREADREGIAQDLTDSHALLSVDGFGTAAGRLSGPLRGGRAWPALPLGRALPLRRRAGLPLPCRQDLRVRLPADGSAERRRAVSSTLSAKRFPAREGGPAVSRPTTPSGLEGRFFNIHAEGLRVGDPLTLGLQWMMDFEKIDYRGAAAILKRRATGSPAS